MKKTIFAVLAVSGLAVMAYAGENYFHTIKAGAGVSASTGLMLAASGGSWSINLADAGYEVSKTTYTPYYVNSSAPMRLYCIGTGTNITSKVALVQCK